MFPTTIAGNLPRSLVELAQALARDTPWLVALVAAPFIGIFVLRDRGLCAASLLAFVLYAFLPFSYRNALDQLTAGTSLRFALPAFATGAVVAMLLLRRAWLAAAPLLLAIAALEKMSGEPTREGLLKVIKDTGKFDIGGLAMTFGPSKNEGLDQVFLTVIQSDG